MLRRQSTFLNNFMMLNVSHFHAVHLKYVFRCADQNLFVDQKKNIYCLHFLITTTFLKLLRYNCLGQGFPTFYLPHPPKAKISNFASPKEDLLKDF